jgi:hypothetical protein
MRALDRRRAGIAIDKNRPDDDRVDSEFKRRGMQNRCDGAAAGAEACASSRMMCVVTARRLRPVRAVTGHAGHAGVLRVSIVHLTGVHARHFGERCGKPQSPNANQRPACR